MSDRVWGGTLTALGGAVLIVAGLIVLSLIKVAAPTLGQVSWLKFLFTTTWDVGREPPVFGAGSFIYGTLVTSGVAILIALPVAVGLALFLTEMAPAGLRPIVSFPLELLAGIPSVVYGLWGLFVMVPLLRDWVEPGLAKTLGKEIMVGGHDLNLLAPLFGGPQIGLGYLAAGVLLAVMILPTITSISIEVLRTVPGAQREAALALGATRWEAIRLSVLPYARAGIIGAVMLGLGRALGETMAVTMVIGNSPRISASLFAAGYSLPSVIANEFAEASGDLHTGALAALGLILFGVTLLLNSAARILVRLAQRGPSRIAT